MPGSRIVVRTERVSVVKVKTPGAPGARGPQGNPGADPRGTLIGPVDLSNDGAWDANLIVVDDLPAGALYIETSDLVSDSDIYIGVAAADPPPEVCLDATLDNSQAWHGARHPSTHEDNSVFPADGLLSFTLLPDATLQLAIPINVDLWNELTSVLPTVVSGPEDLQWFSTYGTFFDPGFWWYAFYSATGGDVVLSDLSVKEPYLSTNDSYHNNPFLNPAGMPNNTGSLIIRNFNVPSKKPYWIWQNPGEGGGGFGSSSNSGGWLKGQSSRLFISSASPITGGEMKIWRPTT